MYDSSSSVHGNCPDLEIAKVVRLIERREAVPMSGDGTTRGDMLTFATSSASSEP